MSGASPTARDQRLVGSLVAGRFLVQERIAAGGMGVVYKAEQQPLGRTVALKILEVQQGEGLEAMQFGERFLLEAAAVAQLDHPNTITVYDYGQTDDGTFFYAMEYVDGTTLTRRVYKKGPLAPELAIHVGMQMAGSLREAHRAGMIHRDLKPGNIMLTERHDDPLFVKVLDFGLVKVMGQEDGVELTQSGMLMGSPRYMAPEQVLGFTLDGRADIYSFGGVLYHALTGFPPFRHGSQFEVLRAQVEETPPPFKEVYPFCKASPRLEALIFQCLEKDPKDRPDDLEQVAAELLACAKELGHEEVSLSGAVRQLAHTQQPIPEEPPPPERPSLARAKTVEEPTSVAKRNARRPMPNAGSAEAPPAEVSIVEVRTSKTPWIVVGLLAALALLASVGAVVFVVFVREPPPAPAAVAEPTPEPTIAAPVAEPSATAVRVESDPPGARVRHGEADLGDAPVSFEMPAGETWELTLSLEGHETRTVQASPGSDTVHVRLSALAAPQAESDQEPTATRRGGRGRQAPAQTPVVTPVVTPVATPVATPVQTQTPTPTPSGGRTQDLRNPWGG